MWEEWLLCLCWIGSMRERVTCRGCVCTMEEVLNG